MKAKLPRIIGGLLLITVAIWGAAYAMHLSVAERAWMSFPSFFTGVIVGVCGLIVTISPFMEDI